MGPRGNGKTALLRWFDHEIVASRAADAVSLTPDDITHTDDLSGVLFPSILERIGKTEVKVPQVGSMSVEGGRVGSLTRRLISRCRRRPRVVLLDEAHNLDLNVGRTLLNVSQRVRAEAPFLLILAGTPNLVDRLGLMGASFWDGSKRLDIGRLDAPASFDALAKPLVEHGAVVTPGTLDSVVAESQLYPYFIQVWGDALWAALRERGTTAVDASIVAVAEPRFQERRDEYYANRYRELRREGCLPVASAVARAFANQASTNEDRRTLTDEGLDRAIGTALPGTDGDAKQAAATRLRELGYIWQPAGRIDWEPGIPSLMGYVLNPRTVSRPNT
ncbi:MAG: AAA family ATPase [Gammaproteobacteria bacterium]|nr:AAA family ATPase [Gammaproteobacteria bacterium]